MRNTNKVNKNLFQIDYKLMTLQSDNVALFLVI